MLHASPDARWLILDSQMVILIMVIYGSTKDSFNSRGLCRQLAPRGGGQAQLAETNRACSSVESACTDLEPSSIMHFTSFAENALDSG